MHDPHSQLVTADHNQEQEVIPAIRLDDAEWKIIQQNTFTRWVNNHLKKAGDSIKNLETDFSDGLKLISLAAVLSQKNVGRFNKKVNFRSQKLENVSLALRFFQDIEHIKIVNIDSSHIVDQNKKLILGLIWTLILHYSISMGWIEERYEGQPEETPKQKLLNWIRSKLPPGMPLTNFTSDWNDGIALGALVNSLVPDALQNWDQWSPENALENTQNAMHVAQNRLDIVPLITPGELIHPEIDEMSVMTYLSQFPVAKCEARNLPIVSAGDSVAPGSLEGVNEFPVINSPTTFTINLHSDGYKPQMEIVDPDGHEVRCTVTEENPRKFLVSYTPIRRGIHGLYLSLRDIARGNTLSVDSAHRSVEVLPVARLCSYTDRVRVGDVVPLRIEDALNGPVEVVVVDTSDNHHALAVLESMDKGVHTCEYVPKSAGLHTVNVFHNRTAIPGSPFPLRAVGNRNFLVWGRGVSDEGIRVGDAVQVHIDNKDQLSQFGDNLRVKVVDDSGMELPVREQKDEHRATFTYTPTVAGKHIVEVTSRSEPIGQSPYKINVSPPTKSRVRAFGPGLEGGVAEQQSIFSVETNGDADRLAFSIEGPSKTEINCQDYGKGAALVSFTPREAGVYKVNVLSGGEHIHASPFVVNIAPADPRFHPSAARLTGLKPDIDFVPDKPIEFMVDTGDTGAGDISPLVEILDKDLAPVASTVTRSRSGLYSYHFTPRNSGKYYVNASLKGVAIPGSPYPVNIRKPADPMKVRIYGPGVEGPVKCREPTHFTIDAKQAGTGAVEVALTDESGKAVAIDVLDNNDGSFTVKYTAPRPGAYQLNVVFAGFQHPPIEINVEPQLDTSGIRVTGLENAIVTVNCEHEMHVFTPDGDNTRIVITSPSGSVVETIIESTDTGFRVWFTPSEIGDYSISVTYRDLPIGAPYLLHSVSEGCKAEAEYVVSRSDPPRADLVTVTGPGLGPVVVQESTYVSIDTRFAGFGDLDLFVDGPTRTPIHCVDNRNGTITMYYVPKTPGVYFLRVMFDNSHIAGSPFQVVAVPSIVTPSLIQDHDKNEFSFSSMSSGSPTSQTTPCV
ncbi:hypothetical protein KIN20_007591 [Parelaphostrongylus tenuis]|uniref:Calponin-homology (CH) domain-containing protein n=1 Tax=Parelaphostrongylus tenuis TaxID=148309 RepID=A0AAD5MVQ5_PARTN|nr:hypothetical protein KIN20_007591 [Parelaphostrongylus tenuis]